MIKTKAAVLYEIGLPKPYSSSKPLKIEKVVINEPGENELIIQVKAAGLCHSDLSSINGNRPRQTPMVLGHEAAGIVHQIGPGVNDLKIGDHVIMTFRSFLWKNVVLAWKGYQLDVVLDKKLIMMEPC